MKRTFNSGFLYAILALTFSTSILLISCKKNESQLMQNKANRSDETIINLLSINMSFLKFNENNKESVRLTSDANNIKIDMYAIQREAAKINSPETAKKFLQKMNIPNEEKIVELYYQNCRLLLKICEDIPELKGKDVVFIKNIFSNSIARSKGIKTDMPFLLPEGDECASAYGISMSACQSDYMIHIAEAALAGAVAAIANPLAGALVYFGGLAIAYTTNTACRHQVVLTHEQCRIAHPIND